MKGEKKDGRQMGSEKGFRIPVWNGLLEHFGRMGNAIWLFLWCIDRTTTEEIDERGRRLGKVLGGVPIRDSYPAESLGCSAAVIRKYRRALVQAGYIEQKRTPRGNIITITNSKKWPDTDRHKRTAQTGSERYEHAAVSGTNGHSELLVRTAPIKTLQDSTKIKQSVSKDSLSLKEGEASPNMFDLTDRLSYPKSKGWKSLGLGTLSSVFADFAKLIEAEDAEPGDTAERWGQRILTECTRRRIRYPEKFLAAVKRIDRKLAVEFTPEECRTALRRKVAARNAQLLKRETISPEEAKKKYLADIAAKNKRLRNGLA